MNDKLLQNEPPQLLRPDTPGQILLWLFWGSFVLFLFLYGIQPVSDPDLWWHLKSGEVMAEIRGLLQFDPFSFTGDGVMSNREALILKGYWLWQLMAYAFYSLLDFNGLVLLNLCTLGAMVGVVTQQLRRQQVGAALAALLLTLGFFLVSDNYFLERPQVVSFLFAALLVALLTRVRDGGQLDWTLPLLMLVWANLHGGFVVGDLILFCFAAGAVLEYHHDLSRLRHLLVWVALGVGASLLNPNGALVFSELFSFHNSELMAGVTEYKNTWFHFQQGKWSLAILWLLIALYGVGLWVSRCLYWPEFLVATLLACLSVLYKRNVGFFAVAMLPAIGYALQHGKMLRLRSLSTSIKYLLLLGSALFLLWQANGMWGKRGAAAFVRSLYPEAASRFILDSGIQGRMFNDYDFGGFLLWKLYPQQRVFIDGRGLDAKTYSDWKQIFYGSLQEAGGRQEFEVLLDRYAIDYVVLPHIRWQSGRLTSLLKLLSSKPEWIPVYVDHQSYILVRYSRTNAAVIERYRLSKENFYSRVIGSLLPYSKGSPANPVYHADLAEIFILAGRYAEAAERLAVIGRLQPDYPQLPELRQQLDVLRSRQKP